MKHSQITDYFLPEVAPFRQKSRRISKDVVFKQTQIADYFLPTVAPVREKVKKIVKVVRTKQSRINDYFSYSKKIIKGYNPATGSWHCTVCGVDMGETNSRQLCCKSYCPYDDFNY
uniref:Uncharacterized protein n=1 Tax=viral metagenome TaxID=1070528 RepID=A0A6C0KFI7_9ZZZZ